MVSAMGQRSIKREEGWRERQKPLHVTPGLDAEHEATNLPKGEDLGPRDSCGELG